MKTLKSFFLGLVLVAAASIVKADDTKTANLTKGNAVDAYVNAMTLGQNAALNDVIDNNAKFNFLHGKKVLSFGKAAMMQYADDNQNVRQQCTTTVSEVESSDDMSIVKVDMNFGSFVRTNYVTVANTSEGWKITNVYSVFK